jgi:hypothetical protein
MGPGAVSSSYIPEGCRPFEGLGAVLGGPFAAGLVGVESVESVRGTGQARLRRGLGHRPYRLGRRTPVLYSRNQSRTNIVPYKEKRGEGRGKLAELLIMVLKTSRGTWIVRGRYWSASRTTSPTGLLVLLVLSAAPNPPAWSSILVFLVIHVALAILRPGAVVVAAAGIASASPKLEGSSLLGGRSLASWK